MIWSKVPPTEPGWYWIRQRDKFGRLKAPEVAQLHANDAGEREPYWTYNWSEWSDEPEDLAYKAKHGRGTVFGPKIDPPRSW